MVPQGGDKVDLNGGVRGGAAGHRQRPDAVELVARPLPLLPRQELFERHGFLHGDVHAPP